MLLSSSGVILPRFSLPDAAIPASLSHGTLVSNSRNSDAITVRRVHEQNRQAVAFEDER